MQAHFEEKITFFGRKVKKVPCIIGTIRVKMNFLGIFGAKHNELLGKIVKIMLDMQTHFDNCIIVSQFVAR